VPSSVHAILTLLAGREPPAEGEVNLGAQRTEGARVARRVRRCSCRMVGIGVRVMECGKARLLEDGKLRLEMSCCAKHAGTSGVESKRDVASAL
jgi:hypothetical protein